MNEQIWASIVCQALKKPVRHEILRFAKAHDVDLIVVAPHGQGVIGTLGSTATSILNNAVCDVLAVREVDEVT